MKKVVFAFGSLLVLALVGLAAAIVLGGPGTPPPLASISDPFRTVDYKDLPEMQTFQCRGGDTLAFRTYKPAGTPVGTVVLIHGSSADSRSMHPMGKAFARAGYLAYALDMRGHGSSGIRGQVRFIGHLEYDVDDFLKAASLNGQAVLVGFSAGGGFALRYAASERQQNFAKYVLLAPFVSQDAPSSRPDGGGWVSVGIPRIVALSILDGFGIRLFQDLPVIRFALDPAMARERGLTAEYSFGLAANFRPRRDWQGTIAAAKQPMEVLVGEKDELFYADRVAPLFPGRTVTIVPGVNHIGLILDEKALQAVVAAAKIR